MDGGTTVALTALHSNDSEISSEELSVGRDLAGQATTHGRRWSVRHILIGLAALIVLSSASFYGHYYWTTGQYLASTDDATVDADSVVISPKISGYLADVAVDDNETVHADQILARIDDRDYRTAVALAQANVASAQAGIRHMEQQIDQQQLTVVAARAAVTTDQAALVFSRQQLTRYSGLARIGAGTVQDSQQWQADITEKEAALARDTAQVGVAQKQIDVFGAALEQAKAMLAQQQAALHQAELNLSYTTVIAPGHVSRRAGAWHCQQYRPGQRRGIRVAAAR